MGVCSTLSHTSFHFCPIRDISHFWFSVLKISTQAWYAIFPHIKEKEQGQYRTHFWTVLNKVYMNCFLRDKEETLCFSKMSVFWDITPCSLVGVNQYCGNYLHVKHWVYHRNVHALCVMPTLFDMFFHPFY